MQSSDVELMGGQGGAVDSEVHRERGEVIEGQMCKFRRET